MTSSGTSTDELRDRARVRRAMMALVVATAAFVAGAGFILWHYRFRLTAPAVVLILGWASVLATVYFLWRTADNADLDDHEDWWRPTGRAEELQREKRSLLKAIRETELDRDTGKVSKEDADEIIRRYRLQAIEVIKAIEEAGGDGDGDGDVRARIEREVRARLQVDRASERKTKDPGKAKGPKAGAAKAEPEDGAKAEAAKAEPEAKVEPDQDDAKDEPAKETA